MQSYLPIFRKCALFRNMSDSDILSITQCMDITPRSYPADSYLFFQNDTVTSIGIVLQGDVEIVKETLSGDRHIISVVQSSEIFGEGIVFTSNQKSPVTARTKTDSLICFFCIDKITKTCGRACNYHVSMIQNMMTILGEKNFFLNRKIELLTLKGMREKIASYLLMLSDTFQSHQFNLPFNRNELAEFLNVSRTSMCRELGRMKEEGLIDYHLNCVKILDIDALIACLSH